MCIFKGKYWKNISPTGRNFVKRLLIKNPEKRMTAVEALKHPWIQYYENKVERLPKFFRPIGLNQL